MAELESQLSVWTLATREPCLVGTLDVWDRPVFQAVFQYHPTWLRHPERFALDPINLPLGEQRYTTTSRFEVLGVLFDAAPDAWGRTIMATSEGSHPTELPEKTVLLKGQGGGVGAIAFARPGLSLKRKDSHPPGMHDIERVFQASQAVLTGSVLDDSLASLLMSSWDMGGARPKAVVVDEQGAQWLAKFPGQADPFSCQRVEWANLEMARAIGMTVPETKLVELSSGDAALLVRRFDRTTHAAIHHHYISAVSLISPPASFDKRLIDAREGARYFSYAALSDAARRISDRPAADMGEIFARMVLNVLVHNTDDHLKNHGFLKAGSNTGYRLAPLFDVVTQRTSTSLHPLHIGPQGRKGSLENALAGGTRMRLSPTFMRNAVDTIQTVLALRQNYYAQAGLSEYHVAVIESLLSPDIASGRGGLPTFNVEP